MNNDCIVYLFSGYLSAGKWFVSSRALSLKHSLQTGNTDISQKLENHVPFDIAACIWYSHLTQMHIRNTSPGDSLLSLHFQIGVDEPSGSTHLVLALWPFWLVRMDIWFPVLKMFYDGLIIFHTWRPALFFSVSLWPHHLPPGCSI